MPSLIADREKWTADKRNEDPLVFGSHPDFLTFPPDGPLRQITIQQMRSLKERASLKPLKGSWRVFLIDGIDRANPQAANSLLKTLEEPPPAPDPDSDGAKSLRSAADHPFALGSIPARPPSGRRHAGFHQSSGAGRA